MAERPDRRRLDPAASVLDHPEGVNLLSVSYPPGEAALVWEISSAGDYAETVRISYLLSNIDRLITYKAVADEGRDAGRPEELRRAAQLFGRGL